MSHFLYYSVVAIDVTKKHTDVSVVKKQPFDSLIKTNGLCCHCTLAN